MTHPLNYCRQLALAISGEDRKTSLLAGSNATWADVIASCERATKFLLPPGGRVLDDNELRALDPSEELNLPFNEIVLEFQEAPDASIMDGEISYPKRIALVVQKGHLLYLTPICFSSRSKAWVCLPSVALARRGGISPFYGQNKSAIAVLPSAQAEAVGLGNYEDEVLALMDLLNALACSNVTTQRLEAKSSAKAMRKALPFDDYHILTIDAAGQAGATGGVGGVHRSPREHLRRGHIRRLVDGRKLWVNATVVNPGVGGRINKSYMVTA